MSADGSQNLYALVLGLPGDVTTPDHYQLLGVRQFTDDPKLIRDAAVTQNAKLMKWQIKDEYHKQVRGIMQEVAEAMGVLLNPERKRAYDQGLLPPSSTVEIPLSIDQPIPVSLDAKPIEWGWNLLFNFSIGMGCGMLLFLALSLVFRSSSNTREIQPELETAKIERTATPGGHEAKETTQNGPLTSSGSATKPSEDELRKELESIVEGGEELHQNPINEVGKTYRRDALPDSIISELDTMFDQIQKSDKRWNEGEMNSDSRAKAEPPPDPFQSSPLLTETWHTIMPINSKRIETGDVPFKNLPDLKFEGPWFISGADMNLFNDYSPDGEWGIQDRVLEQVSGNHAAMSLARGGDFLLTAQADVSNAGGCFFLIGWDGLNGYLIYHHASPIDWSVVEIKNGKWVQQTQSLLESNFRSERWHPFTLSVSDKQLTWKVGRKVICDNVELPNYKNGAIIFGTYSSGPKLFRIKSMRLRSSPLPVSPQ